MHFFIIRIPATIAIIANILNNHVNFQFIDIFLNSLGVRPVRRLKKRTKCWG